MLVIHDEELTRQLEAIAAQEKRPVEAVLKTLLAQYTQPEAEPVTDQGHDSQWLAAHIEALGFETDSPIDPVEADELLRSEFADALWRRLNNAPDTGTDR